MYDVGHFDRYMKTIRQVQLKWIYRENWTLNAILTLRLLFLCVCCCCLYRWEILLLSVYIVEVRVREDFYIWHGTRNALHFTLIRIITIWTANIVRNKGIIIKCNNNCCDDRNNLVKFVFVNKFIDKIKAFRNYLSLVYPFFFLSISPIHSAHFKHMFSISARLK